MTLRPPLSHLTCSSDNLEAETCELRGRMLVIDANSFETLLSWHFLLDSVELILERGIWIGPSRPLHRTHA